MLATSTSALPYSAYPEHLQSTQPGVTYQGPVAGLAGWNDPPPPVRVAPATPTPLPVGIQDVHAFLLAAVKRLTDYAIVRMANPRMVQDTQSRIQLLQERLSSKQITEPIITLLITLCHACEAKDRGAVYQTLDSLTKLGAGPEGKWIVGFKRVLEIACEDQPPGFHG